MTIGHPRWEEQVKYGVAVEVCDSCVDKSTVVLRADLGEDRLGHVHKLVASRGEDLQGLLLNDLGVTVTVEVRDRCRFQAVGLVPLISNVVQDVGEGAVRVLLEDRRR